MIDRDVGLEPLLVHPVYIVGVGVVCASRALASVVPGTSAWQALATWLIG